MTFEKYSAMKRYLFRNLRAIGMMSGLIFSLEANAVEVVKGFFNEKVTDATFDSPIALDIAKDGRIFIAQQDGFVRVVQNGKVLATPFLKIAVTNQDEHGLLGLALDPDFATNHYIYFFYTTTAANGYNNRISRFTESNSLVVPNSEKVILNLQKVPAADKWHNGGALHFGKDGKLYAAVGNHEDLSTTDPAKGLTAYSQDLSVAFGKMLRINKDGSIPSDNPFVKTAGAFPAIWARGLRNPFSFGISQVTGQILINDVGFETYEEINVGVAGENYGWPLTEGPAKNAKYKDPAYSYRHSEGCSIMGGVFYEPEVMQFPANFNGRYLVADYCGGWIRAYNPKDFTFTPLAIGGINAFVSMALSSDGYVYYMERNSNAVGSTPATNKGTLSRIGYTGSAAPRISVQPQSQTVLVGSNANFSVDAVDATSYQWTKNGVNINGATNKLLTVSGLQASDNGAKYSAIVRNASGSVTSAAALLTVTTNNLPVPVIIAKDKFESGETLHIEGIATDKEDGNLPASKLSWTISLQHDEHSHPALPLTTGKSSLDFLAKSDHSDLANTWFQVHLTATDSGGRSATVTKDIFQGTLLSSLTPTLDVNGSGPHEDNTSVGESLKGDGRSMMISGVRHLKGLGVHAASELNYYLGGACNGNLLADIGIDDEAEVRNGVVFAVYNGTTQLYRSAVITKNPDLSINRKVNVSMKGVQNLRLVVENNGDSDWDHADWGSIKITNCGTIPSGPVVKGLENGATYTITSSGANACLQMDGGSTADGAKAVVAACNGSASQKFKAQLTGTSQYNLINQASGKCVDVTDGSTANGALIQQWGCTPNNQQKMIITPDASSVSTIKPAHSQICIDVDGTKVQQWGCHGGVNQSWKFTKQ
jgi:glucose/arabinose dehydrogenase